MEKEKRHRSDSYDEWVRTGRLEEILKFIRTSVQRLATKTEIAKALDLTPQALIILRKKHKEIDEAFILSKMDLKKDLIDSMLKLALGYEEVTKTQDITDTGVPGGQKKKVNRVKKQVGPNYKAVVYMLTKHFGKEFSDKYDELKIMERRLAQQKEEWLNESTNTSDSNETEGSDSV